MNLYEPKQLADSMRGVRKNYDCRRTRRRNEPKPTSLSARWGFLDSDPAFAKGRFIFEGRPTR